MSKQAQRLFSLAKKPQLSKPVTEKPSVFGEESDEEPSTAAEKFKVKYSSNKNKDQRLVEKVMSENPDAYKYDEIYEELEEQKRAKTAEDKEKDAIKAPKYMDKMITAHKKRELEKLIVEERKFKKERVAEGGAFDDKEAFVTGAYKQQIEEMNKMRDELNKQDYMDSFMKVENQKMWQLGFNRKLLDDITMVDRSIKTDAKEEHEVKIETTETDIKPDVLKVTSSSKKTEEKDKKKSIYSDGSENEALVEKPKKYGLTDKKFQEIRPGLNRPKVQKSPSPRRRSPRKRSRSRDRRRTPDRYRRRSPPRRSRSRDRRDTRRDDRPNRYRDRDTRDRDSQRYERRRSRTRSKDRRRSRSRDVETKKRARHDTRSPSPVRSRRTSRRSPTPEIIELKKVAATSIKKYEEEKNAVLSQRLEKVKEILKQRNTEDDIRSARERYFQRLASGEVTAPVPAPVPV